MPLSNVWAFPSRVLSYQQTLAAVKALAERIAKITADCKGTGHPIDVAAAGGFAREQNPARSAARAGDSFHLAAAGRAAGEQDSASPAARAGHRPAVGSLRNEPEA